MKKVFLLMSIALIACVSMAVISCSNEDEHPLEINGKKDITIKLHIPNTVVHNINKKINMLFSSNGNLKSLKKNTASEEIHDLTDTEAKCILSPLVTYGVDIRDQLLQAAENDELLITLEERELLENMDDSQLAGLAYFSHALAEQTTAEDEEENELDEFAYTVQDVKECLTVAMGIDIALDLYRYFKGTSALMTAKTALQIGKAFMKRTMGWIGIAYTAYKFGRCLHER